jgi:predicted aspartyl protease
VIRGVVSADGVPIITLSIIGREWTAIIDTGFNGDLELPEDWRDSLNAWYVGRVKSALAGGQIIEEDVYLVEFPFDDRMVQAEATFVSSSQILLGTHLLQDYRLEINFVSKAVKLEGVGNHREKSS